MKRYYVVIELEVKGGKVKLSNRDMASWLSTMIAQPSVTGHHVTVYESAADLYFDEANRPQSPRYGYVCRDCTRTFERLGRSGGHACCPHCGSERYTELVVLKEGD